MISYINFYRQYGPQLLSGLLYTVCICAIANVMAIALGVLVASLQRLPLPPIRWACRGYIELLRGTPILIQLFILYYVGPLWGIRLDAIYVGILGLGIYGGAYFAEIFRAGFQSIPKGQIEAARLLGMSTRQIVMRIEIPEMLTLIIPPSVNQVIGLVKESAALSIITVPELTKVTVQIVSETFQIVPPYVALAVLFWILVEAIARAGRTLERRMTGYWG
jgi:polar amino acid transport system permease protein